MEFNKFKNSRSYRYIIKTLNDLEISGATKGLSGKQIRRKVRDKVTEDLFFKGRDEAAVGFLCNDLVERKFITPVQDGFKLTDEGKKSESAGKHICEKCGRSVWEGDYKIVVGKVRCKRCIKMEFLVEISLEDANELWEYANGLKNHISEVEDTLDAIAGQISKQIGYKDHCYLCGRLFKGKGEICSLCRETCNLRLTSGVCVECDKESVAGHDLCKEHLKEWSIRKGRCQYCFERPAIDTKQFPMICSECQKQKSAE